MLNHVDLLDDGSLSTIFSKLSSPKDIAAVLEVCKRWRLTGDFVCPTLWSVFADGSLRKFEVSGTEGEIWKSCCLNKAPAIKDTLSIVSKFDDGLVWKDLERPKEGKDVEFGLKTNFFCQLAWELTKDADHTNRIKRALKASSTDNYPEEAIEKTLQPSPKWPNPSSFSYWSSKGKEDPKESETLTYELEAPVSLVILV